jgi:hypothetical protein
MLPSFRVDRAGHQAAADELRRALARLDPVEHIRAYTELSFGLAFHLLSVGAQHRFGVHREQHDGMVRWLRERGAEAPANLLDELERIRTGHWYGRQGNGHVAQRIDEIVAALDTWALA